MIRGGVDVSFTPPEMIMRDFRSVRKRYPSSYNGRRPYIDIMWRKVYTRGRAGEDMQWATAHHAGVSTADELFLSVIEKAAWSCHHFKVAAQRRDSHSLLNCIASLIRLRKECPQIGWSGWKILDC